MATELSDKARKAIEEVRQRSSTSLSLGNENLEEIPEEVFGLSQLETLELIANRLRVVPKRIRVLSKLRRLGLTRNPIQDVPDIPGLILSVDAYFRCRKSLTPAHILGLEIAADGDFSAFELLPAIAALPRLRELTIRQFVSQQAVRPVQEVIDGLGQLCSLESLCSYGVLVGQFPQGIRQLKALHVLWLQGAGISRMPRLDFRTAGLVVLGPRWQRT